MLNPYLHVEDTLNGVTVAPEKDYTLLNEEQETVSYINMYGCRHLGGASMNTYVWL